MNEVMIITAPLPTRNQLMERFMSSDEVCLTSGQWNDVAPDVEQRFYAAEPEEKYICKRHPYNGSPCYDCQQEKELRLLHEHQQRQRTNRFKRMSYLKRCLPQQNGSR